jgi:hypothetical protein
VATSADGPDIAGQQEEERPGQIELHLGANRPQVRSEWHARIRHQRGVREAQQVQCQQRAVVLVARPQRRLEHAADLRVDADHEPRQRAERHDHQGEVQRQDPQPAAHIEAPEERARGPCAFAEQ